MKTARVNFLGQETNKNVSDFIRLAGTGTIEVDSEALRVVGKKGNKLIPTIASIVVGLVCLIASIILMTEVLGFNLQGGRGKMYFLIGFFFGIIPGALVYSALLARLPGTPVAARIPWSKIRVRQVTPERIDLASQDPALPGCFAFIGADPQSEAVLAETFQKPA